jgi:hypothetical protein
MMNICDAGIHLGVDPDVAAKSSKWLRRGTRPMNDEICTMKYVVMTEVVKRWREHTTPSGDLQVALHTRSVLLARWRAQILFETAERYENVCHRRQTGSCCYSKVLSSPSDI